MLLTSSDANTTTKNKLVANTGDGLSISADTDGAFIFGNVANHNYGNGIESDNASATFGKNTAHANRLQGIAAPPGVIDLGGNKASKNGDPAQCTAGALACS